MADNEYKAIRGMRDILPTQTLCWNFIEATCLRSAIKYGYQRIMTPVLEKKILFTRSVGEASEIVNKEMYQFEDRNGDVLALRPEGTACCVRAAIQNNLIYNKVARLCYLGPMFRRERPQKGRYRQFYQFGIEQFGLNTPEADVEVLLLANDIFNELGLTDKVELNINYIGNRSVQQAYGAALYDYFKPYLNDLDAEVVTRLESNPLRLCDSKDPDIQAKLEDAPKIVDFLDQESIDSYSRICGLLDEMQIRYVKNTNLVRGLDYYTHLVYEWLTPHLGSQSAVGGGGRYNQLVEEFGAKASPAAGFGLGLDRLFLLLEDQFKSPMVTIYMAISESSYYADAINIAKVLRKTNHVSVIMDNSFSSMKTQVKKANNMLANWLVIVEDEHVDTVKVRRMTDGEQFNVSLSDLVELITQ